jgi:ATP-dependent DNA helicase RecG
MTPDDVQTACLRESERVEWKESDRSDTEKLLQAVCGLANDLGGSRRPGFLVLGMRNDGTAAGLAYHDQQIDQALQSLVSRLTSPQILPAPSLNTEAVVVEGKTLFIVRVEPYPVPPVVTVRGVAWVRRGTTTVQATEADLLRLRERRPEHQHPFDSRPVPGATLDDVNLPALRPLYEVGREGDHDADTYPPFENWLTQRQLGRPVGGVWTPNPAALLLFGESPQTYFAGAIVEFARYAGDGYDAPLVSRKTITGTLTDQLDVLWVQLNANLAEIPGTTAGMRTPYLPEYPLEALRELARNLVQHRLYEGTNAPGRVEWFEDRIVFSNPGGPFGRASEGELGTHSDYRNPSLTRGLVELGYVERLGRGIRLVRSLLAKNDNPPLEVEVDGFTTVIVRRRA